ncbi:hypothetical protein Poli38472_004955 [Pythium oligandrum]|uniref:Uncharacterized protein n=1 Tax=Pythium oligandrum TaxID=41045 RepID=A0A8K1CAS8_PYTOL|nr:hypothetical protein Poli38472_004955 [Pythium oligandrum]|eukprot:TMW59886.1 hypothetical protein Poli38472_004955 [Pythium oligandrum]
MEIDDDALLDAFLAALDPHAGTEGFDYESRETAEAQATPVTTAEIDALESDLRTTKKVVNQGMKGELETLRRVVSTLETRLRELQSQRGPNHRGSQRGELLLGRSTDSRNTAARRRRQRVTSTSVWREIAFRQYEQRQQGQLLNHRLKDAVHDHNRVISELQRLIRRGQRVMARSSPIPVFHSFKVKSDFSHSQEHERLMRLASELYQTMQSAVRGESLQFPVSEFQNLKIGNVSKVTFGQELQMRTKSVVTTLEGSFLVPMPCCAVAEEVWLHYGGRDGKKQTVQRENPGTLVDSRLHGVEMTLELPQRHGRFNCALVGNRYEEGDSELIVIEGQTRPIPSESTMRYVSLAFEKWYVIRPVTEAESTTQVLYSEVTTITFDSATPHAAVNSIVNFVVKCAQEDLRCIHHEIDAALLSRPLAMTV